ncbi:hypothetical protein JCM17380_38440 [Desulfosporosinus burensis]
MYIARRCFVNINLEKIIVEKISEKLGDGTLDLGKRFNRSVVVKYPLWVLEREC